MFYEKGSRVSGPLVVLLASIVMLFVCFLSTRDLRRASSQGLVTLSEMAQAMRRNEDRDRARVLHDQEQIAGLRSLREAIRGLRSTLESNELTGGRGAGEAGEPSLATKQDAKDYPSEIDRLLGSMAFRGELAEGEKSCVAPKGLRLNELLSTVDLNSVVAHPELNPEHRVPSFAESTKAVSVLRQAKAMVEILDPKQA